MFDSRGARGLFEQIAETTPDILYVYDVRLRRHVYINRRVHDLLGYAPEELAGFGGDLTAKLTHPDDLPLLQAHFAGLADLGDNEIASVDHRMLHADGTYRWLSCRGTVFARGDDGRVSHVIGQVRDFTDQRRMVDALRESDSHLRAILDNVPALIWMAAVRRALHRFQQAGARLHGPDARGASWRRLERGRPSRRPRALPRNLSVALQPARFLPHGIPPAARRRRVSLDRRHRHSPLHGRRRVPRLYRLLRRRDQPPAGRAGAARERGALPRHGRHGAGHPLCHRAPP